VAIVLVEHVKRAVALPLIEKLVSLTATMTLNCYHFLNAVRLVKATAFPVSVPLCVRSQARSLYSPCASPFMALR